MSKITKATIKSFIKKNKENLYFRLLSRFDGMIDCVDNVKDDFKPVVHLDPRAFDFQYRLGIKFAFFVGGSRNWFKVYEDDNFNGYEVSNCCGDFVLAVRK